MTKEEIRYSTFWPHRISDFKQTQNHHLPNQTFSVTDKEKIIDISK